MIVTLTANPSIDRTVDLTGPLVRGGVVRASGVSSQPAGKGVNISRAALAAGIGTTAVFPAEPAGHYLADLVRDGVVCRSAPSTGPVRVNLTLTEPDGVTTKVNTPGAHLDAGTLEQLASLVVELAGTASWVVLAGSLPPGAPVGWYADLCARLRATSARVAVDTSEAPLLALVETLGHSRPDLLKPNGEELAQATGHDPAAIESDPLVAEQAARELVGRGAGTVLVTLGARGALLVDRTGAWLATPPPIEVVSTVGAGDSSLFGYLLGDLRDDSPPDRLRLAVAYGSAAAGLPGTTIPHPGQTRPELVHIAELIGTTEN